MKPQKSLQVKRVYEPPSNDDGIRSIGRSFVAESDESDPRRSIYAERRRTEPGASPLVQITIRAVDGVHGIG